MTAIRKETSEKIVAALTDDQKKSWKELTGAPVRGAAHPPDAQEGRLSADISVGRI